MKDINHIIFLIHPCCYEALSADIVRKDNYALFVEMEKEVKRRWLDALSEGPRENLFVQLGGPEYLTDAARKSLGLEYTFRFTTPFPESKSMHEYYVNLVSELRQHIARHQLRFDPEEVSSELWGESFEGCVPGYGGAFAEYLGLRVPPTMRFEMTVHDSRLLYGHRRREVIPIPGTDVEAWCFECHDASSAAMFQARLHAQWIDQRRVSVQLDDRRIQVTTKLGHTVWPAEPWKKGKQERVLEYHMSLADSIWYWIRSIGMTFGDFRNVVSTARISSGGPHYPTTAGRRQ